MARQSGAGFETTWIIPQTVALPRPPCRVRFSHPDSKDLGKDALQNLKPGEVVHITGGAVDAPILYGVAADPLRGGWLAKASVQCLSTQEALGAPQLPLRDQLLRITIVQALEDWVASDEVDGCMPSLQAGELLQLGAVRDTWVYGWSLDRTNRRGWFPLALAQRLESVASSLVSNEEAEELPPSAGAAIVDLIRSCPQPPANAQTIACPADLPPAVAESARRMELEWQDRFDQMDAQAKSEAAAAAEDNAAHSDVIPDIFPPDSLADDSYPLFVCRNPFNPPQKRKEKALLRLEVGDLVRVVSVLEATMFCGFHEGRPSTKAWFPRRCVEQLEDPLDIETDAVPFGNLDSGAPPLPEVPHALKFRGAR
jgi:hypothetical protein